MAILIPFAIIGFMIVSELFKRAKKNERLKRVAVLSLVVYFAGGAGLVYAFIIHPAQNRAALMAGGIATPAEITGLRQTGSYVNENPEVEFRLEVQPENKPAYTATFTSVVQQVKLSSYPVDKKITVLVDPDDPQNLLIKGL